MTNLQYAACALRRHIRHAANNDCEKVKTLVFGVLSSYGLKPDPGSTDADLDNIEEFYFNRGGIFYVLDMDGDIRGSAGLYRIDEYTCELRKMYLHQDYRGIGIGKCLLELLLDDARRLGYGKVVLETASVLKEAINIYKRYGFHQYTPHHLSSRCDQAFVLDLQ